MVGARLARATVPPLVCSKLLILLSVQGAGGWRGGWGGILLFFFQVSRRLRDNGVSQNIGLILILCNLLKEKKIELSATRKVFDDEELRKKNEANQ